MELVAAVQKGTITVSMPALDRATLRVGDGLVRMSRNRWAPTHRGRSLDMTFLGDAYKLSGSSVCSAGPTPSTTS